MTIAIQRDKSEFLYLQVVAMIRQMQKSNTLRPGDRLPSLRGLSEKLAVSIPTIKQAYAELERQGVITAKPKSGYYLQPAQQVVVQPKRKRLAENPMVVNRQSLIEQVFDAIHRPGVVSLGLANPASAHSSDKALARLMRQMVGKAGVKGVSYGPMNGYPPLKQKLALRYLELGLQVDAQELIITNGAQEALSIALQCVAKPGDIIAVESPVYFGILELIESLGMMVLEIPLCPEDGIWLEDLERGITEHPIKACLFSASISNPLGSFMNKDKQRRIVELLEKHDIPLIEDDVYGDLYFTEQRGSTAQLFSKKGLVMTCSSFSKTAAPGYRVGWLLPGKFGEKAKRFKRAFSCASPTLSQWVLSEYLASGEYDRNTQLLRQALLLNKQRMIAAVTKAFPPDTRVSDPKGAGVLWIELPMGNESETFFHLSLEQNVSIAPGTLFSPSDKFKRCIRLSYGIEWNKEIETAITTIGHLCK